MTNVRGPNRNLNVNAATQLVQYNVGNTRNIRHFGYYPNQRSFSVLGNNGRLQGFAIVKPNKWMSNGNVVELKIIGVRENLRSKGIGKAILNAIKKAYTNKNIILNSVPKAVNFYRREGFTNNNAGRLTLGSTTKPMRFRRKKT